MSLAGQVIAIDKDVADNIGAGDDEAVRIERLLQDSEYADGTMMQPELINITRKACSVAVRMDASRVTGEEGGDGDEVVEDLGKGAQAELPPGVQDWPPESGLWLGRRVFPIAASLVVRERGVCARREVTSRGMIPVLQRAVVYRMWICGLITRMLQCDCWTVLSEQVTL